ncbi:opsin-3 isoform X2 [Hydra vulgaris]|uniref:Opsin-3 isoform X2 n=1 Tax=Hydra vulgaris TaxID=6087 RepID=A0ABM4CCQ2_HYDVU
MKVRELECSHNAQQKIAGVRYTGTFSITNQKNLLPVSFLNMALNLFLFAILFTSVILNATACYVILLKVKKKEITHLFITSISLTNMMESIVGFIPQVVTSNKLLLERTPLCISSGFAVFGCAVTSITHITVLSFIRIIVIKYPFFYYKTCKKIWVKATLVAVCYLYGFSWATFPLIGWSKYELDLDKKRCSLDWKLTQSDSASYFLTILIFCNILPAIVISTTLYTSKKIISKRKAREDFQNHHVSLDILENDYLKVCLLSTATFFFIWTPYAVVGILTILKIVIPTQLVTAGAMFAKLSTITNVIINCFIVKSFKNQVLELRFIQYIRNIKKKISAVHPYHGSTMN